MCCSVKDFLAVEQPIGVKFCTVVLPCLSFIVLHFECDPVVSECQTQKMLG